MTQEPAHPLTERFTPSPETELAFRRALGQFGTGVTIVTCATPSGPLGMTANSFTSVSLHPPLVLWSPARASSRHAHFVAAPRFAVHVAGRDQAEAVRAFARTGDAFHAFSWHENEHGVPILEGCLSVFECTRHAIHEAGDHSLILGAVERVTSRPGEPLLFHGGRYGGFTADD